MRKISYWFVTFMVLIVAVSCADYDEGLDILSLEFPSSYDGAHNGLRVELQNGVASTFVDSTDAAGVAHFRVPSGLYKISCSARKETYDYRYFFNGSKAQVVVSSDSSRVVTLPLVMSKKRIVH